MSATDITALPALLGQLDAQAAEIERLNKGFHESCIAREDGLRANARHAEHVATLAKERADRAEARVEELEAQLRRIASTSPRAWHRSGCAAEERCLHCRALIDEARDALGWARWPAGTGTLSQTNQIKGIK